MTSKCPYKKTGIGIFDYIYHASFVTPVCSRIKMPSKLNFIIILFALCGTVTVFTSCQKEIDGLVNGNIILTNQKPKLGTQWTYRYYVYHPSGNLYKSSIVIHKAKTEETLGGEKWLNIVDVDTDTTVYFLNVKTGGLYQYTNASSNLLCKYPAAINDTYTSFNEGATEDFIVKGVNDTLPTGIGDVPANYYEGFKVMPSVGIRLIDLVWYNENAWIVRKSQYRSTSIVLPFYYKYYTYFLDNIVY